MPTDLSRLGRAFLIGTARPATHDIVPIPGTRSAQRVAENVAAAHLTFTREGLDLIGPLLPNGAAGDRYRA